jgi:hypothetical protein
VEDRHDVEENRGEMVLRAVALQPREEVSLGTGNTTGGRDTVFPVAFRVFTGTVRVVVGEASESGDGD